MIIPKLISSKEILEKIYSDTGATVEINTDDFKLWVAEIYDLAGMPAMYRQKVIGYKQDPKFDFKHYQVPLPCDFRALVPAGIAVNGSPTRWSQNSFHYLLDGECCGVDQLTGTSLDIFEDNFGNEFSPQLGNQWNSAERDVTFDIYNGKITFNIKEGKACVAYWAYPIDNEGYLEIPDDAQVKRMIADYVIYKQDYIQWRTGNITDKVYEESVNNKNWSIGTAANKIKLPDVEQTQLLMDTIIKLLPDRNEYSKFFKGMGQPEQRHFR